MIITGIAIKAIKWDGSDEALEEIHTKWSRWGFSRDKNPRVLSAPGGHASVGDWVVLLPNDAYTVIGPEEFEAHEITSPA